MNTFLEVLVAILIVIGAFFVFVGSLGLLKLSSLMARLHAPSKATTLGLGSCLVASILQLWRQTGTISMQEILITFFLFITAPVTAHFLAQAYIHTQKESEDELPIPSPTTTWTTLKATPRKQSLDSMTSGKVES